MIRPTIALLPLLLASCAQGGNITIDAAPIRGDTGPRDASVGDAFVPEAMDAGSSDGSTDASIDAPIFRGDAGPSPQRSCSDPSTPGCGTITVGRGTFDMGSAALGDNAIPVQTGMQISVDVRADIHEVTVARFRRFWDAGHPAPGSSIAYASGQSMPWSGAVSEPIATSTTIACNWSAVAGDRESHPINCVDWETAQAFCVWDGGRLPTEAEWEWIARGRPVSGLTTGRAYPWGDQVPLGSSSTACDRTQWNNCAGEDGALTRRVGRFAPQAGIYDLAGNVWEWSADYWQAYTSSACWNNAHPSDPLCTSSGANGHAFRGGAYDAPSITYVHSAAHVYNAGATLFSTVGLRCVQQL